jgi:hypothetical protein
MPAAERTPAASPATERAAQADATGADAATAGRALSVDDASTHGREASRGARPSSSLPLAIRLCTHVFLPLIRALAGIDARVYAQALSALRGVLADATSETLTNEPEETLEAVRLLLLAVLAPSATTVTDDDRIIVRTHIRTWTACVHDPASVFVYFNPPLRACLCAYSRLCACCYGAFWGGCRHWSCWSRWGRLAICFRTR